MQTFHIPMYVMHKKKKPLNFIIHSVRKISQITLGVSYILFVDYFSPINFFTLSSANCSYAYSLLHAHSEAYWDTAEMR